MIRHKNVGTQYGMRLYVWVKREQILTISLFKNIFTSKIKSYFYKS